LEIPGEATRVVSDLVGDFGNTSRSTGNRFEDRHVRRGLAEFLSEEELRLLVEELAFREDGLLDVLEESSVDIELFEIRGNPSQNAV
jgi:hypothetical protein